MSKNREPAHPMDLSIPNMRDSRAVIFEEIMKKVVTLAEPQSPSIPPAKAMSELFELMDIAEFFFEDNQSGQQ